MTLDRRDFLVRTGLLVGGGALAAAGCRSDDEARRRRRRGPGHLGGRPGGAFELDPRRAQLSSFLLAAHPRPVRELIETHRRRLDADTAVYLQDNEERLEAEVLQAAAGYLGVAPEEVAAHRLDDDGPRLALRDARARPRRGDRHHRARLLLDARGAAPAGGGHRRVRPAESVSTTSRATRLRGGHRGDDPRRA